MWRAPLVRLTRVNASRPPSDAPGRSAPRVAIVHQGFIPTYRVTFFERLAQASDVEYVVFHGDAPPGTGHRAAVGPFGFREHKVRNRRLDAFGGRVIYQPLVRAVARHFDAAVVGAELKLVANVAVGAALAATGRPVILWGQGFEKDEDRGAGALRMAGDRLKSRASRAASAYLVYSERGARRLAAAGVNSERITVVRNTLDMRTQERWEATFRDSDEGALRAALGLRRDSVVLVYLGRVYREKRLDELVDLVRALQERGGTPVEAAVIGDGPDLERVRARASGVPGLHFTGAIHDDEALARWLRVGSAVAIPGKVGLAVNHALAHGVPVLTRESGLHAPEVEYLHHDENGLIVPGSFDDYVDAVAAFTTSDEMRGRLAAGALASRSSLGLDAMVAAFDSGVRRALG